MDLNIFVRLVPNVPLLVGDSLLLTTTSPIAQTYHVIPSWGVWVLWGDSYLPLSVLLFQDCFYRRSLCWSSCLCIHEYFQVSIWENYTFLNPKAQKLSIQEYWEICEALTILVAWVLGSLVWRGWEFFGITDF